MLPVCVHVYCIWVCNVNDMWTYTVDAGRHGEGLHLFFSSSPLSALRAWLLAVMKLIQCLRSSGNSGQSICTQTQNYQTKNQE